MQDNQEPWSGKLPVMLQVGEDVDLLLPYNTDCFLGTDLNQIGIMDSFGKIHWSTKKQIKVAKTRYKRDFGGKAFQVIVTNLLS